MLIAITDGYATGHHVGITNRFHLVKVTKIQVLQTVVMVTLIL